MIHSRARRAREQAGLSQQSAADRAGIPRSQLQLLEKGGNVTRETLEKALAAVGLRLAAVSVDEIATARRALRELDGVLARLAGPDASSGEPDDLSPDVRRSIVELDALVDLDEKG
ncbi:MAG TPA: helix-turn-helix transcriptional regulator [Thermoanaerobaculia bacterium]|nr:helix-turn-helix transcriptional regulator [Thermoanaerobaculia bacterium]